MSKKSDDKKSEDFSIDLSGVKNFFKNLSSPNYKVLLVLLLILIPMFFSIYYRSYSYNLPAADDFADTNIYNSVYSQMYSEVNSQFPNLPNSQKVDLAHKQTKEYIDSNWAAIKPQRDQIAASIRANWQDESGQTYLLAIDPYFFYRYAENIIEDGMYGDEIVDGQLMDNHMKAPDGHVITSKQMHVYVITGVHKFLSLFSSKRTLLSSTFFVPIFISALAIIPAFFIGKKKAGYFGGFMAAMIVGVQAAFIGRTAGGFADTDAYNVLFPLFITWLFLEAFESQNLKKQSWLMLLTGALVGLYSFAWIGWWFILYFLIGVLVAYHVYVFTKNLIKKYNFIFWILTGFAIAVYVFGFFNWQFSGIFWNFLFKVFAGLLVISIGILTIWSAIDSLYKLFKYLSKKDWPSLSSDRMVNSLIVLILLLVCSGIFVSLISGPASFSSFASGPFKAVSIKDPAKANLWPNVYTTVAELNPASINSIIQQMGGPGLAGKTFFFIVGLGLILTMMGREKFNSRDYWLLGAGIIIYIALVSDTLIKSGQNVFLFLFALPLIIGLLMLLKDDRKMDVKYAIFLTIWMIATIYASLKGTRFVLLMVPAFAVAFGIATGSVKNILSNMVVKEFKINKIIVSSVLILLLLLLLINPLKLADSTSKGEVPSMDDGWWASLTKIRDNSSENAIITSWWDFGHWFKAVADRPVTFDGGSQNVPQAHWVGKILLTSDENQAISILRMLDCGGNNAFDKVNKKLDDTEDSVDIVYEIIMMDKSDAENYLFKKGFSSDEINTIIGYTHCEPPQAFFITSGDMVGKAGVWAHFGSWNFDRAFIYRNVKNKNYQSGVKILTERFNYSEEDASSLYYDVQSLSSDTEANSWIAPWPSYASSSWRPCGFDETKNITVCSINMGLGQSNVGPVSITQAVINASNPEDSFFVLTFTNNEGQLIANDVSKPARIVIADEELIGYNTGSQDIQLELLYDAKGNRALLTQNGLAESMFTKLFFLEGRYTEHFEKFSDINSGMGRILIWDVNW